MLIDFLLTFRLGNPVQFFIASSNRYGAWRHKSGLVIKVTIGTGMGSDVFYDGQLIPNFKLGYLLWKEGKVIEKYAADSVRKQENLEFDEWGERLNEFLKHLVRLISPDYIIISAVAPA